MDLQRVERMTSSFANALVMTILDGVPRQVVRDRLNLQNASEVVEESINRAIERFDQGVRLTIQRPRTA